MPSDRHDSAMIRFQRNFDIGGRRYQISADTSETSADTVDVDVFSIGPGGEVTEGKLSVSVTALPHLGPLLNEVLGGIAMSFGVAVDPTLGAARDRPPKPSNAGQPWTDERKAELTQLWLDTNPTTKASDAVSAISTKLSRTPDSIRSALQRQKLDPDRPGRAFGDPG